MTRGFSLIETIIYVALLGLLLSGGIVTAYQITQSSYVVAGKNATQEEGHFVLRKLEHAFVGASDVSVSGSTLTITRYGTSAIDVGIDGDGDLYLDRNSFVTDDDKLTTDNVTVGSLVFTPHTGPPKGVTMQLTLDGDVFTLTQYVR